MSSNSETKTCTGCREIKPVDAFRLRTTKQGPRRVARCLDCERKEKAAAQARRRAEDPARAAADIRRMDEARERQRAEDPHAFKARETAAKRARADRRAGISPELADRLRAGPCALCGALPDGGCELWIDEATGAVRGALCRRHRRGLSLLGESADLLLKAAEFVQADTDLRDLNDY